MNKIHAFIDSYEIITILVDKTIKNPQKKFYLSNGSYKEPIQIITSYEESLFYKYVAKFIRGTSLHKDYYIIDDEGNEALLQSGSIVRTKEFEEEFKYDGPLGVEYHKEYTIIRVWSPVAKEIKVGIIKDNLEEQYSLFYKDCGVWEITLYGDYEGIGYILYSRVAKELVKINDPYAISSATNGEYNYIINPDKLYKMKYKKPKFSGNITDSIIYEASIRDFTCNLESENKGTFLGMLENNPTTKGYPTGIEYIKSLGVTHLQLMPIFDFGGVDDDKKDKKYNWGYNPEQFFVPCGWYSKNPNDPYSRINELLELVDNCHNLGLRVVMDVVFNHVFVCEKFAFDNLVPGYFYRVEYDGNKSNASGCGNVIATERYMASRFVIDALEYYTKVFNISGFRFDLMGLLDINTLNEAQVRLKKLEPEIILYGEGWNMMNPLPDSERPHMYNHYKMPEYAFFNDRFRDLIRGSQWNKSRGFAFDSEFNMFDISHLISGSCLDFFKFYSPTQTINYIECHDNYTFFDFAIKELGIDEDKAKDASRFALQTVIMSEGVPFIHAGEEFFRTKNGIENSYNAKDSINKFDYKRRDRYYSNIEGIKDLIEIRKEYPVFRLTKAGDIRKKLHLLDGLSDTHMVGILYQDNNYCFYVLYKNDYEVRKIPLEAEMIFDGKKKCAIIKKEFKLEAPGVYILRKEIKNDENNWKNNSN